jgi:Tol biopolymer transport system component
MISGSGSGKNEAAEQVVQLDRGRILVSRGMKSLQRPRQVGFFVRRRALWVRKGDDMIRRITNSLLVSAFAVIGFGGCSLQNGSQIEHRHVAFDVSPDGQRIVFSSADGDLYLFHLQNRPVVRLTQTARTEQTPAFSPDGKSIVFAADAGGSKGTYLFVCSVDGQNERQLTKDPAMSDSMPSYSRDGSQIVFARAHRHRPYSMGGWTWDNWDVYVMKSDGTAIKRVTQNNHYSLSSPQFLVNDKAVVYSTEGNRAQKELAHSVFEVKVGGNEPATLLTKGRPVGAEGGAWGSEPSVSTDGTSIAFISDRKVPYAYDVVIMNRDGTKPRSLGITSIANYNQSPRFHPEGKTILFLAGTETNAGSRAIYSLWQVDSDGKNPRRIADSGLFTDPLKWKPKQ